MCFCTFEIELFSNFRALCISQINYFLPFSYIGGIEENDSGVHDTLSKNDSLLSSSQQNDSAYPYEDSSEDSTDRSIYSPVKLRHPKHHK